jgi:hypothetical protein
MLEVVDFNAGLDRRRTTPEDIVDCLAGMVERGEVRDVIVITDSPDDDMTFLHSENHLTKRSEIYGLCSWALSSWANREQHGGGE